MEVKIEPLEEKKVQMKELEEKEEIGEKKEAKKDLADMMSTTRRAGEDPIEVVFLLPFSPQQVFLFWPEILHSSGRNILQSSVILIL
mmetsp:Transcript_27619/g.38563  ORF Transcript_27619/g.38563 Transcript_27619/m.38563 type:complete len:87 (+) Transcript_27619:208-468(+)